jgi:hypothetical protein
MSICAVLKRTILLLFWALSSGLCAQNPFINWGNLQNPVYAVDDWSVKDASMIYEEESGLFYLFFSAFFHVGDRVNSHVVSVKTKDWVNFSDPLFIWEGAELGYHGLCSPEVHHFDGKYVLTYNGWGDKPGKVNQLYYAESYDLENWDKHIPLGREVTAEYRAIDAALAYHEGTYFLYYKESRPHGNLNRLDLTRAAYASGLDGPWQFVYAGYNQFTYHNGSQSIKIHENYRLLEIDGTWYMQNTGYRPHEPYLFEIGGNSGDIAWWTVWSNGILLEIPVEEGFNTAHRANAAHLQDWRKYDGYFYLLYAGNTENESFWGRGNNRLGLARSKDLIIWEVPSSE